MQARPTPSCGVCLSVRLSVCYVRIFCQNKQTYLQKINSPSGSQPILIFHTNYRTSWQYSDGDPPNGGVECKWGGRIAGYRSMNASSRDQQLTVVGAVVYHSYGAHLFTAQRPPRISENAKEKRTEHNLFVCSGKYIHLYSPSRW